MVEHLPAEIQRAIRAALKFSLSPDDDCAGAPELRKVAT